MIVVDEIETCRSVLALRPIAVVQIGGTCEASPAVLAQAAKGARCVVASVRINAWTERRSGVVCTVTFVEVCAQKIK